MARSRLEARKRRKVSIRKKLKGTPERPRLTVFRSNRHIYVQVVDDENNKVLASASTEGGKNREGQEGLKKVEQAKKVGSSIAQRCLGKGIAKVVFDRNGYKYHGRVMALAKAARESGLEF
jgi:large subunit ribosomal protein L18